MLDKFLPPTDNLYKFLAISGLLLIAFSFYPAYLRFKVGEQSIENLKNISMLGAEADVLDTEIKIKNQINDQIDANNAKINEFVESNRKLQIEAQTIIAEKNGEKIKQLNVQFIENNEKIRQLLNQNTELKKKKVTDDELKKINETGKNQDVRLAELAGVESLIKYYEDEISRLNIISLVLMSLGVILSYVGFKFWYQKIQKFNDLMLEIEYESKRIAVPENAESESPPEIDASETEHSQS